MRGRYVPGSVAPRCRSRRPFSGASASLPRTVIKSAGVDGTAGDMVPRGSNAVIELAQADSGGGVSAIAIVDANTGSTGQVGGRFVATLPEGLVYVRFKLKKASGSIDSVRLGLSSFTASYFLDLSLGDGSVLANTFALPVSVAAEAGGWFSVEVQFDTTGWADLTGFVELIHREGTGSVIFCDGTQRIAYQDIFVES